MHTYKRFALFILFFIFLSFYIAAQTYSKPINQVSFENQRWKILEQAHLAYEQGDYAKAIRLADNAKITRKQDVDWSVAIVSDILRAEDVQKAGDEIDKVLAKLSERGDVNALYVLTSLFNRYPPSVFDNSITKAVDFLKITNVYPEADFLLGKLYLIEGEYDLAQNYYLQAFENRNVLDIPTIKYDILYDLAYLAGITQRYTDMEEYLLLILASDTVFGQAGSESMFLSAVVRTLHTGITLDKFFHLYRHDAPYVLPAYIQLAQFYYESGRIDKSLPITSLGSLIAFTTIYTAITQKDFEFKYTSFAATLNKMLQYSDITEWTIENDVWELFFLFAQNVYDSGQRPFAVELFTAISVYAPEELWRQNALNRLLILL